LAAATKLLNYNRIFDFAPASGRQILGQAQRPIAQAHEAIYLRADRLEKTPHFPIAAFLECYAIPGVAARGLPSFRGADGSEGSHPILKLDAGAELFKHRRRQPSVDARDVLAL